MGWRPGWDLAGTVIKQVANDTGPKVGSRVVGMVIDAYTRVGAGAWAEQVAVPTPESGLQTPPCPCDLAGNDLTR